MESFIPDYKKYNYKFLIKHYSFGGPCSLDHERMTPKMLLSARKEVKQKMKKPRFKISTLQCLICTGSIVFLMANMKKKRLNNCPGCHSWIYKNMDITDYESSIGHVNYPDIPQQLRGSDGLVDLEAVDPAQTVRQDRVVGYYYPATARVSQAYEAIGPDRFGSMINGIQATPPRSPVVSEDDTIATARHLEDIRRQNDAGSIILGETSTNYITEVTNTNFEV